MKKSPSFSPIAYFKSSMEMSLMKFPFYLCLVMALEQLDDSTVASFVSYLHWV